MAAVHLVGLEAEPLSHDPALEVGREEAVAPTEQEPGGHVRPGVERPRLLERGTGLVSQVCLGPAITSAGTSCRNSAGGSSSSSAQPPPTAAAWSASAWPVLVHQSPGDSPGAGTMAATSTIISTGTRVATGGAVNPPIDWATSTRSPTGRVADGLDHRVGVLGQAGGVVVDREGHGDHVVTAGPQLGLDQVPVPARWTRPPGSGRRWPCDVLLGSIAGSDSMAPSRRSDGTSTGRPRRRTSIGAASAACSSRSWSAPAPSVTTHRRPW